MKLILSIVLLLLSYFTEAQTDSSSYDKLFAKYQEFFLKYTSNSKGSTFLEGIEKITRYYIRPENHLFKSSIIELRRKWTKDSDKKIGNKIADSLLADLRNISLWKGDEAELLKFNEVFRLFNDKYCNCLTANQVSTEKYREFEKINKQCDTALITDVGFINSFRSKISVLPVSDQLRIQPMMAKYLYANCPYYTRFLNQTYVDMGDQNISNYIHTSVYELWDKLLLAAKSNSYDSIQNIFPDRHAYKKSIDALGKTLEGKTKDIQNFQLNESGDKAILQTTFYEDGATQKITGQVILEINCFSMFSPLILSVNFIAADKVKNKADLLKRIKDFDVEPPPPPQVEIPRSQ